MGVGMLGYLGIGVESSGVTSGNSGVAVCDFIPIISENLATTPNPIESQGVRAQWDIQKAYNGLQTVGGNVSVEIHPDHFGYFMRSFFDTSTTDFAPTSNANFRAHRFIAANGQFQAGSGSDVPTLSFEVYRGPAQSQSTTPSSAFFYWGNACNVFEVTMEAGQLLRASMDYLGRDF